MQISIDIQKINYIDKITDIRIIDLNYNLNLNLNAYLNSFNNAFKTNKNLIDDLLNCTDYLALASLIQRLRNDKRIVSKISFEIDDFINRTDRILLNDLILYLEFIID